MAQWGEERSERHRGEAVLGRRFSVCTVQITDEGIFHIHLRLGSQYVSTRRYAEQEKLLHKPLAPPRLVSKFFLELVLMIQCMLLVWLLFAALSTMSAHAQLFKMVQCLMFQTQHNTMLSLDLSWVQWVLPMTFERH